MSPSQVGADAGICESFNGFAVEVIGSFIDY
jgi:hypothetical protein